MSACALQNPFTSSVFLRSDAKPRRETWAFISIVVVRVSTWKGRLLVAAKGHRQSSCAARAVPAWSLYSSRGGRQPRVSTTVQTLLSTHRRRRMISPRRCNHTCRPYPWLLPAPPPPLLSRSGISDRDMAIGKRWQKCSWLEWVNPIQVQEIRVCLLLASDNISYTSTLLICLAYPGSQYINKFILYPKKDL